MTTPKKIVTKPMNVNFSESEREQKKHYKTGNEEGGEMENKLKIFLKKGSESLKQEELFF